MTDGVEAERSPRPARILVVDDEKQMRFLLRRLLRNAGHDLVTTAANGPEALEQLRRQSFDLAIVDLVMPKIGGMEVLEEARKLDPAMSVIMLTAHASVSSAVKAMKAGAYDYVTKPFHVEEMKAAVGRALERRGLLREVEQKEAYRQMSITDGLTGLHNHRYFQEVLSREVDRAQRYARPLSLLMIDIDDFKTYNDTNGHLAGDQALGELARVLGKSVRRVDFVARYGGEEFAMILPETASAGARAAAEHVRDEVAKAAFEREDVLPSGCLTVSVGVATLPDHADSPDSLIHAADQALYHAKREGKNRVGEASAADEGRRPLA